MFSEIPNKYEFIFATPKQAQRVRRKILRRYPLESEDVTTSKNAIYCPLLPRWSEVGEAPREIYPPRD